VDGTYHHKLTHCGRTVKISTPGKKTPLVSITVKQQLLGTAAFYADDTMTRLPRFTPDGRVNHCRAGPSVFSNIRCAAFNSYIFHRNHEVAFLGDTYSAYEDGSFTLVAVNVFCLECFPNHKVGMIVYKGRGTIVDQQAFENAGEPIT